MKTNKKSNSVFIVPTLVSNQAMVNAPENYSYRLIDVNGRVIESGRGVLGTNNIEMSNKSAGLYFIELIGVTSKEIKRIIKQ